MQHFIVPVDGSTQSWRAVDVALGLARRCRGRIEVVEVVFDAAHVAEAEDRLTTEINDRTVGDVSITAVVLQSAVDVAGPITELVENHDGSMVVMASSGRGRTAALFGSVAEDLLQRLGGPIVVVGPHSQVPDFSGPTAVTVDGSDTSEAALPIAAAWSLELGTKPWVVEVVPPDSPASAERDEAEYVAQLAGRLSTLSASTADHRVLRADDVASAVARFVDEIDASLIVASTHGRTGTSRLVVGSTAADLVRSAPCPLLLVRPKYRVPN